MRVKSGFGRAAGFLALAGAVLAGGIACAEGKNAATAKGAAPDPTLAGAKVFQTNCVTCHAASATGNPAMASAFGVDVALMNLTSSRVRQLTDTQVTDIIRNGKAGKMPAWKGQLNDDQIADVVAYLRSLEAKKYAGKGGKTHGVGHD